MLTILVKRRDRDQWLESPRECPILGELVEVLSTPRANQEEGARW